MSCVYGLKRRWCVLAGTEWQRKDWAGQQNQKVDENKERESISKHGESRERRTLSPIPAVSRRRKERRASWVVKRLEGPPGLEE